MNKYFITYFFTMLMQIFFFIKIVFVLRKKPNQITFLHLFHHISMVLNAWSGVRFVAGGQSKAKWQKSFFFFFILICFLILSIFSCIVKLICSHDHVCLLWPFSTWSKSSKIFMVEEIYHPNAIGIDLIFKFSHFI